MALKQNHNRKQIVAFAISVALFLSLLVIMERIGVPRLYAFFLTAFYGITLSIIAVIRGATTSKEKFFFSDRAISANLNAFAISASVAFPVLILNGAALFFAKPSIFVLFSLSVIIGLALITLIISRPLRQSGASNLSNFFKFRFKSKFLPKLLSIINLIGGGLLFVIAIHSAANLASWFFAVSNHVSLFVIIILTLMAAGFGGISSITRQSGIAIICILAAINIPLMLAAVEISSFPIGQLSFGSAALDPSFELDEQLAAVDLPALSSTLTGLSQVLNWSNANLILTAICITLGIVAMPAASQQFTTARITERAATAGERSLLVFGLLTLSIFALAAFAKISFYESILGLTTEEAGIEMPFLFEWGSRLPAVVSVCEQIASAPEHLVQSCNNDPNYAIQLSDLKINSGLLLATIGSFMGYPFALTAFIVVALLLVLVSIASANLFAISSNLVNAFYSQNLSHITSFEMVLTRLIIVFVGIGAGLYFTSFSIDYTKLFIGVLGFYASSLLPSIVGGFLWKKTTSAAAIASIMSGSITFVSYWIYAGDLFVITSNPLKAVPYDMFDLPAELSAVIALPVSIAVLIAVSVIGKKIIPLNEANSFANNIFEDNDAVTIVKNRF